jgi:Ca2+-binding RTX toxin-like protein
MPVQRCTGVKFVGSALAEAGVEVASPIKTQMKNNRTVHSTSIEASRGLIPTAFAALATITRIKPKFGGVRKLLLAVPLALGLSSGSAAWGKPAVQSVEVSPDPLIAGQNFTITVAASDATQGTATVDFHPGKQSVDVPLITSDGLIFTGSGVVPEDLERSEGIRAKVKVTLFDSAGKVAKEVVHVDARIEAVSAFFARGVLTIIGDKEGNVLTASRDTNGTILVNGGAVAITGDVPTTNNTSLIQIFGLGGADVLLVDDSNGRMPPATLLGGEGDDDLTGSANLDELDGGPGADELSSRGGDDRVVGGSGDDNLDGGPGRDQFFGGEGDDQIVWIPGDGSDLVEGDEGTDTMLFIGANGDEAVSVSAVGQRVLFFRNPGNITMDCDGIELVEFRALGGRDEVTVGDLTATQVADVVLDLNSQLGIPDGVGDAIQINGTTIEDNATVSSSTNGVSVLNLAATVTIVGSEPVLDLLRFIMLSGDDIVDASALADGFISLIADGGAGDDMLIGSAGADVLLGGDDDDVLMGGPGIDVLDGGPGNNVVIQ